MATHASIRKEKGVIATVKAGSLTVNNTNSIECGVYVICDIQSDNRPKFKGYLYLGPSGTETLNIGVSTVSLMFVVKGTNHREANIFRHAVFTRNEVIDTYLIKKDLLLGKSYDSNHNYVWILKLGATNKIYFQPGLKLMFNPGKFFTYKELNRSAYDALDLNLTSETSWLDPNPDHKVHFKPYADSEDSYYPYDDKECTRPMVGNHSRMKAYVSTTRPRDRYVSLKFMDAMYSRFRFEDTETGKVVSFRRVEFVDLIPYMIQGKVMVQAKYQVGWQEAYWEYESADAMLPKLDFEPCSDTESESESESESELEPVET